MKVTIGYVTSTEFSLYADGLPDAMSAEDIGDMIDRHLVGKEPEFKANGFWCPVCGHRVFNSDADAWCGHCGQKMKWE